MKLTVCFSVLFFYIQPILHGLKISLTVGDFKWNKGAWIAYHVANYENFNTILALNSLFDIQYPYSAAMKTQYYKRFCAVANIDTLKYVIFYLALYQKTGLIDTDVARNFLSLNCMLEGPFKAILSTPAADFLSTTIVLNHNLEALSDLPSDFAKSVMQRAIHNPNTATDFFVSENLQFPNQLDPIFLLDGLRLKHSHQKLDQDLIPKVFRNPTNFEEVINSLFYLIHLVFVMTCHKLSNKESISLHVPDTSKFLAALERVLSIANFPTTSPEGLLLSERKMDDLLLATHDVHLIAKKLLCNAKIDLSSLKWNLSERSLAFTLRHYLKIMEIELSGCSQIRLRFGQLTLALIESEIYKAPTSLNLRLTLRLLASCFDNQNDISLVDLRMLAIIIWDYVQMRPGHQQLLSVLVVLVGNSYKLTYTLLDSADIPLGLKKQFPLKSRLRYIRRQFEILPKYFVYYGSFPAPDTLGGAKISLFSEKSYRQYYDRLTKRSQVLFGRPDFIKADAQITKALLIKFVPWLLQTIFARNDTTYIRPIITVNGKLAMLALRNALSTSFSLGIRFKDFALGLDVLHHFWELYKDQGSGMVEPKVFMTLLLNNVK